jgi:hypothetical protein
LAENGIVAPSDEGGVVRTWDLLTGLCEASFNVPAQFYSFGDTQMIDGRLIIAWLKGEIHIWNTEDKHLQIVDRGQGSPGGLKISGDESKVLFA